MLMLPADVRVISITILPSSSSHYINVVVFSCASDTQCQAVTFDGSQCHLFYSKLPYGHSPSESVGNWYGECEESDTLTPVIVITTATTTTAEVTTASTTTVTSSKTGKSKHETSCEDEGQNNREYYEKELNNYQCIIS